MTETNYHAELDWLVHLTTWNNKNIQVLILWTLLFNGFLEPPQNLWWGLLRGGELCSTGIPQAELAMLYLRYKSSMTCLLSCSVCAFTPTTFTACGRRSERSHRSLRHHPPPPPPPPEASEGLPCLLCWPWWSWGSADECWRPWWQERWFPPAASPDTGRWRARPAGWSTGGGKKIACLHFRRWLFGNICKRKSHARLPKLILTSRAAG